MYLGAMGHWAQTTMPQLKATTRIASKYMSRPTKLHFQLVIMMVRYCMYTVREGICLVLTGSEGFEGVLELLFFTDSDHVGNTDGTSNSGMMAFINNNYFHGYSCGQKCLTLNTAESEYIAMVKCLQFAIWVMLLLRELQFRVKYPIPILADNVAAILIAKSPGHTKYARHIALRTHYIRSILPFRDFILAYIKTNWNFADLNTKAVTPDIFRRLSLRVLCGLHTFNWRKEVNKTLEEIWQQTKARDDAREMEEHVERFNETRRTQRAEEVAKERELLRLEQQPTKQTTNVVGFTSAKGRTSSGGVRESVAVNAISNNEAMRFGLDKFNKGNQIMRKMGWRKGSIGKDNDGIATALTGQSIGGQTNRAGLGSKQGGASSSSTRSGGARKRRQQKSKQVPHTKRQERKVRWSDTKTHKMKITMRRSR